MDCKPSPIATRELTVFFCHLPIRSQPAFFDANGRSPSWSSISLAAGFRCPWSPTRADGQRAQRSVFVECLTRVPQIATGRYHHRLGVWQGQWQNAHQPNEDAVRCSRRQSARNLHTVLFPTLSLAGGRAIGFLQSRHACLFLSICRRISKAAAVAPREAPNCLRFTSSSERRKNAIPAALVRETCGGSPGSGLGLMGVDALKLTSALRTQSRDDGISRKAFIFPKGLSRPLLSVFPCLGTCTQWISFVSAGAS